MYTAYCEVYTCRLHLLVELAVQDYRHDRLCKISCLYALS